ncbi:hypothetical protein [Plantibacter flavus]|uniref:hypothetical protein n=1 Tax=Plantibacter flavus TaxID=150123 RepID=UPI0012947184|nr:hypothetical protein [Plantibacter flavus]
MPHNETENAVELMGVSRFVAALTAATLCAVVMTVAPAQARAEDSTTPTSSDVLRVVTDASELSTTDITGSERDRFLRAASQHLEVQGGAHVDVARASVLKVEESTVAARFDLVGENVVAPSSLTVFLNDGAEVVSTVEMLFQPDGRGGGSMSVWQDSIFTSTQSVTASQAADALSGTVSVSGSGDWWGELSSCLSQSGVPVWAASLLATACAVACAVTVGIGCGVCLAALIGTSTGITAACIDYANSHA